MTDRTLNRRRLLVSVGCAGALTGCIGGTRDFFGDSGDDPGGSLPEEDLELRFPAVESGQLIDHFEDLERWTIGVGELSADEDAVHGTQSMRLESTDGGVSASAFAIFDGGLDLSGTHLSAAVKVDTPGRARVTARLLAPDRRNRLEADRTVVGGLDGWIRVDFGYTGIEGEPDLSSVAELRLAVESLVGEEVRVRIDDLRAIDAADTPRAVLVFDGAFPAHYETAFPLIAERDGVGVVPISRDRVGSGGRLGVSELRELRDAGWDIASRPRVPASLPELGREEQERIIGENQSYLEGRGFANGARHLFPPGYAMDETTVEVAREVHDSVVTFGGSPNANPPMTRFVLSRFDGDEQESSTRLIDLAGAYNQSVILGFPRVGHEDEISASEFEAVLDFIDERDFEIVSLSELLDA